MVCTYYILKPFCNLLFIKHLYRNEQTSKMYKILLIPIELSNISGLSKQTLLFYKKKKIFISEFKNEKGIVFTA